MEFAKVEAAAHKLLNVGINPALLKEIKPWLQEFAKLGERGQKAIQLGEIFRQKESGALLLEPISRQSHDLRGAKGVRCTPHWDHEATAFLPQYDE